MQEDHDRRENVMRTWISYVEKIIYGLVSVILLAALMYMVSFIVTKKAPLISLSDISTISEWTYTDQAMGEEVVKTPIKVDTNGRDVFVFESVIPDDITDGSYIAFLNRVNMRIEINGNIIREWKKADAPIVGGPSKNSYFITALPDGSQGSVIRVIIEDEDFGGKFFDAYVGEKYEVIRYLEMNSGAVQFILSISLLILSLAVFLAGIVMQIVNREQIKLVYMAAGIFVISCWMVVDSFVFQFLFRIQYIDGFMSYITTLSMPFPFIAYLDAIQEHRYRKWYVLAEVMGFLNLVIFASLHILHIYPFFRSLLPIDIVLGVIIVMVFAVTVTDIIKGNYRKYRYVAYGFVAFMVLAIIEIVLINTVVERTEGSMMIVGLYILFAFAIVQQLAEIRQVQVERDRANEEGITKTKFLASMSHEIRTPINSILGMNEMILRESRDPDILNYAGIIGDSGTMLLSLINDILDFSKLGSDMEKIVPANYDPGRMFDNAVEMLETQAKKKDLTVKIGKPRNLPKQLYGDEKRISQIVINLLSNAVKYTNEGSVTFSGECFNEGDDYTLCFYVSDTGIGIKTEDLDSIFDPFHRLEMKKNQNIQGTGLGLSIAKNLTEKMGGQIRVESVYGKGSTFSVRIPQKPGADMPDDRYNSGNAVEDDDLNDIDENYIAPEVRVLEVDDNLANQVVVREFLKQAQIQPDMASDGAEALRLCRVNRYDIILMDHMMPGMDGIEAMHAIRSQEGGLNTTTPVIVLTANAIMGSKAKYEAEGFDNYLSKPVESARLLKMIRKYLDPAKVMYKPKKRTGSARPASEPPVAETVPAAAMPVESADGPVDLAALFARFDNREETVNLILGEIVKEGNRKIPLLSSLAESGDIKRYAIEAHGVKGVMASSCVPSLSATAKTHELAAKEGNLEFVRRNVDSFLEEYRAVLEYITEYLDKKGIKVENDEKSTDS